MKRDGRKDEEKQSRRIEKREGKQMKEEAEVEREGRIRNQEVKERKDHLREDR